MVSECLNNAARHAAANQVWVRLAPSGKVVYVEVGDDGRGFDLSQALNQPGHYGLLGMRERAALAGGRLEISSTPGLGTVVRMEMPIESRVASFESRVMSGE
jgi:two-component system, NarL family, sensor histidine kinase YdfH